MNCSARLLRTTALVLIGLVVACRTGQVGSDHAETSATIAPDTARGILSVVGSEPMSAVVLSPATGPILALEGSQAAALRRLSGLDVMITGRLTNQRSASASPAGAPVFEVDDFVVRASDRVEAHDGVLTMEGGRFTLSTARGERMFADHLPAALRAKIGARVFLVGPLDRPPIAYGVISERP